MRNPWAIASPGRSHPIRAMIRIASGRLAVDIDDPDSPRPYPRFSRAGFVRQVVLDGRHAFCGEEGSNSVGSTTAGAGLCQEFGLEGPCGFDDCLPGECFPKISVGLLERPDLRRYSIIHPYACRPFPIDVEASTDHVRFVVQPLACRGYALRLEQFISIADDRLIIDCAVDNLGERSLMLEEYRHDFLAPGGREATQQQTLRFDRPLRPRFHGAPSVSEDGLSMPVAPPPGRWMYRQFDTALEAPTSWTFHDPETGLGLVHATDRPWTRFSVWIGPTAFSPECFLVIACRPGERQTWRGTYTFSSMR